MQDDFDLDAILTITTGVKCTDDFNKVYELFWFIFEDDLIGPLGIGMLKDTARNHILRIHPELKNVRYDQSMDIDTWVNNQKEYFGDKLTISILGENVIKLEKQSYASNR